VSYPHLSLILGLGIVPAALATFGPVATIASQDTRAAAAPPVTFSEHIAPLVFDHCSQCHRPGGSAPFSLLTFPEVRQRATQIAAVTGSRYMPPWKAEPGYGEFIGQDPLTGEEIDLIQRWIDGGALEGDPRDLPSPPHWTDGWQLGTPDLIVTLPEAYMLPAEGPDVFRTFALRLPIDRARYVRGLEFRPANPQIVHHANIRIDPTPASLELDRQDPDPGFTGMAHSAVFPDGHFLAWAPGQVSPMLPKGLAWRVDPGTDLVFQLHLQPSGKPETVQTSVGFFFTDDVPTRKPLILRLARQDIDIPPGEANYSITDSYVLPVDVEVQSVQPHAHFLGRDVRVFAELPDGTTKWLVYIKDWDFRWQHVYRYVAPFVLPRGTTLRMQLTYDNSADNPRNPSRPPLRIGYGWESATEMGEVYIQVFTDGPRERETLYQAFQKKSIAEDIAGYKNIIARNGGNVALLHHDVGVLYLQLGRAEEAIGHFETSLTLQPGSAVAQFNLGTALMLAGRFPDAIRPLAEAVRLQPDYAVAHNNLADALLELGRADEALSHYREAVRAAPRHAPAHNNLGLVLMQRGDLDEAVLQFLEALRFDSSLVDAHYNLGHALTRLARPREAISHFLQAVQLAPDDVTALRSAAWMLATAADEGVRDANEAVRLAERAAALTGRQDAEALGVLAAGYASAGLFERALETNQEAVKLVPGTSLANALLEREDLYKRDRPYREPGGPPDAPASIGNGLP
jgi:tetratricopeptide (TPR) repeat protein/mono/diheme cytochrome c family protein